jgi:hypothetical protein
MSLKMIMISPTSKLGVQRKNKQGSQEKEEAGFGLVSKDEEDLHKEICENTTDSTGKAISA